MQTFDNSVTNPGSFMDGGKLYLSWENRSNVGIIYNVNVARAGKYYLPDMGFELLEDYSRAFGLIGYGWVYNEESKKKLRERITFWTWLNKINENMKTDILKSQLSYSFSMKSGYGAGIDLSNNYEYLPRDFYISDELVFPVGEYLYQVASVRFRTPSNNLFAVRASFGGGSYYDGSIITFGPAVLTMRISPTVRIGVDYQFDRIAVPTRDQYFTSHLARLRTEFTFTTKLSLQAFFQYSSSDAFGINNIRFRYNPREGNDLYIVYNGSYNTQLHREYPALPRIDANTIILKYTYTFIWDR